MVGNQMKYCPHCMTKLVADESICYNCNRNVQIDRKNTRHLRPNTILNGKYLVGKVLGEGGFGITYLAIDLNLNMKVAIKEYFPNAFSTRTIKDGEENGNDLYILDNTRKQYQLGLQGYEEEAHKLAQFTNFDGIVSVLNFFYENNTAYMVMEYIDGIDLKTYLKENGNRLNYNIVLQMMEPVIRSLSMIHRTGIIHRDISPDNIMIDRYNRITVIDFGAARNFADHRSMTVMLKRGYAPPEQYQTKGNQGTWTDVYSICATMYRMITGKIMPESLEILYDGVKAENIKKLNMEVPQDVSTTIHKGLEVDINNRIHDLEELYNCLYGNGKIKKHKKTKKNKKLIGIITAIVLSITFLIVNNKYHFIVSEDEWWKGVRENNIKNITVADVKVGEVDCLTIMDCKKKEFKIPNKVGEKEVVSITSIGTNVVDLVIDEGVTEIKYEAFSNSNLERLYIPRSVENISSGAFLNCKKLKRIDIDADNKNFKMEEDKETKKIALKRIKNGEEIIKIPK